MLLERRKFTLEEYHRLAETGFLGEDDRVELIDGEINEELVWVYRNPSKSNYLDIKAYKRRETLTLLAFPDIAITANETLGETIS